MSIENLKKKKGLHFKIYHFNNLKFEIEPEWCFYKAFPHSSVGKESACNAGDPGLIPGSERSLGEGIGYPLLYSGLENSIDSPRGDKESDMTECLSLTMFWYRAILKNSKSLNKPNISLWTVLGNSVEKKK